MAALLPLFFCLGACGGGAAPQVEVAAFPEQPPDPVPDPQPEPASIEVSFDPGPIAYAVEASVRGVDTQTLASVSVRVRSKPGAACADVHVTYPRSYLDAHQAISAEDGTITLTVFGLYADYDNNVELSYEDVTGQVVSTQHVVTTGPAPGMALPTLQVLEKSPQLGTNFLLIQLMGPPAIVDIDGEVRWRAPQAGLGFFPRACTPGGLVAGSMFNNGIFQIDWLGRVTEGVLNDPRCLWSHHNLSLGKTGFLDTVNYDDGMLPKPESVLVETSASGDVTSVWDFDQIFQAQIQPVGEDPILLAAPGSDWFHMNAAVYDASDDSILASSRENFIVKVDHQTGAIRWLLGNPEKLWYTAYPASLQPLALTVIGSPPVGQHAISVSPDGSQILMFDNGNGNLTLPDVADGRGYSQAAIFQIDEQARTAERIWNFDFGGGVYCPTQSSAYWTKAGDVVIALTAQAEKAPDEVWIVNPAKEVLFRGAVEAAWGVSIYAAEEIRLEEFVVHD